jgi:hypothetical protein
VGRDSRRGPRLRRWARSRSLVAVAGSSTVMGVLALASGALSTPAESAPARGRAELPHLPLDRPLEPARRPAARRPALGHPSCAPSGATRRSTPTSARDWGRAGRSGSRSPWCPGVSGAFPSPSATRTIGPRSVPHPPERGDRGRPPLHRRSPRDRRRPRPVPAVGAVRRLPGTRRRALARRLWGDLAPALEPASPRGLDLRRRGWPAHPPRPRAVRGAPPRLDQPRPARDRAPHAALLCLPGAALRLVVH